MVYQLVSTIVLLTHPASGVSSMTRPFVQSPDPVPCVELREWQARTVAQDAHDLDSLTVWTADDGWQPDGRTLIWDDETTIVWFRQRWTVPRQWAGKALMLSVEVRNGQRVYVDGQPAGGWHVLTASAERGRTYRLAIRGDRGRRPGMIMRSQICAYPAGHERWIEAQRRAAGLVQGRGLVLDEWHCQRESDGANLAAPSIDHSQWPIRRLGEQWKEANSCYWFRMGITVPDRIDGFGTAGRPLRLTAMFNRRGSIWVDGEQRAEYARGLGDAVVTDRAQPGTEHVLAIRVPTNWTGWLRDTRLVPQALADAIAAQKDLLEELGRWDRFLRARPDPRFREAVLAALAPVDSAVGDTAALVPAISEAVRSLRRLQEDLADEAPFVALPYLQLPRSDAMTIRTESLFGRSARLRLVRPDGSVTTHLHDEVTRFHRFVLTGLQPDTEYRYTVSAGNATTEEMTFTTAPSVRRSITLAVLGDSHYGPTIFEGILDRIAEAKPDLAFVAGDLVGDGVNEMEWIDHYLHPLRRLRGSLPVHVAVGNHDHGSWGLLDREDNPHLDARFDPSGDTWGSFPYAYSFDYAGVHFVFIDPLYGKRETGVPYGLLSGTPQYEWLRADLEGSRSARWTILFVHEPPFCETWEGGYYDGEPPLREHVVPLMEELGVDLCISGHAHTYERGLPHPPYDSATGEGNTVAYLITGGGGATLDNRKYREWPQIDIPPHRVVPNENFLLNDHGEFYRYHFCTISIDDHRLECTAHWVRTDGTIVDVLDTFILRKGVPMRSDPPR